MRNKITQSKSDYVFDLVNYLFLSSVLIVVLYPLVYIASCSFSSPWAVIANKVWLYPVDLSIKGYQAVFENKQVWTGYLNSLIYAVVGTAINVIVTTMAAYPLSRRDLIYGKKYLLFIFTFTMIFSGGMIPRYLLVKSLKLLDTRWALMLPNAMSVWNMLITKTYFENNIPNELYEAAEIDGSRDIGTLIRIVLPLSGPIIAVISLFYAVGHWNSYFDALIFLKSASLFPLQIILRNILIINQVDASMIVDIEELMEREGMKDLLKYSLIIVASVPVLMIYPFVQKYFVKGIMIGSLKG